ncbi:hypothetical protein [Bacillus phage Saddex]|nr:hypothetical protein [Bacillus phage Saddex]
MWIAHIPNLASRSLFLHRSSASIALAFLTKLSMSDQKLLRTALWISSLVSSKTSSISSSVALLISSLACSGVIYLPPRYQSIMGDSCTLLQTSGTMHICLCLFVIV